MDMMNTSAVQKVVVVNGNTEVLGMLETVLDAGRYDMVFVESSDHAYTQVRKVLPDLVILCARIDKLEGFNLLTMLKLDPETREIPVLTYTTEHEGQDFDEALEVGVSLDIFLENFPTVKREQAVQVSEFLRIIGEIK
jgi:two-component system chemotaxis response regulator CheY